MRVVLPVIVMLWIALPMVAQTTPIDLNEKIVTASDNDQKLDAFKNIIDYYQPINTDSAIFYAEKGLKIFTASNYKKGEAWMLDQLGEIDDTHGRSGLAKERLRYAKDLFHEVNDKKGETEVAMSLGIMDAEQGNYIEATNYFVNALKYYDSIKNKGGMLRVYTNLGIINERNNNKQLALDYFKKAEDLSKNFPVCDETIDLYNNIGGYYIDAGDTAQALRYLQEGIRISDKAEFISSHLSCLINMGVLQVQLGQPETGIKYLKEAYMLAKLRNFPGDEANILTNLMTVTQQSDPEQCLEYSKEAIQLCEETENRPLLADIYDITASVFKSKGDYKNAYDAREKRQAIIDSLDRINKSIEIANIGAVYELTKSNDRVKQMQALNLAITKKLLAIIVVCVVFILVLVVVVFYYRKSSQLNKQLMRKEKELSESNAMKDKLFSIIGHDLRAPMSRIPSIVEICSFSETSNDDKQFLMQNLLEHSKASLETLDKLLYWGQLLIKGIMIKQEIFKPYGLINDNIALKSKNAEEKKILLVNNVPKELSIFADPNHFDFIVRNLLMNAIKFSFEDGSVVIRADEKVKPGFVVFSVTDSGIGIDKQHFETIFEPHYTQYGTANEKGTGIGLMLCKEFALKNGGNIWLESEVGKGTTFYFTLKKAE